MRRAVKNEGSRPLQRLSRLPPRMAPPSPTLPCVPLKSLHRRGPLGFSSPLCTAPESGMKESSIKAACSMMVRLPYIGRYEVTFCRAASAARHDIEDGRPPLTLLQCSTAVQHLNLGEKD